jgi:hypothetical protein
VEVLSPAGVTGALLGLVMGWVDYKIAGGIIERKLSEAARAQTGADNRDADRRMALFRRLLLIATVGVFPVVGYVFGRAIAG